MYMPFAKFFLPFVMFSIKTKKQTSDPSTYVCPIFALLARLASSLMIA